MKRRKTIFAGPLIYDCVYPVPAPRATAAQRKAIREVTREQIARTNANTAQRKLEMLIACNFTDRDLVLTLTFRDADLPGSMDALRRRLQKLFAELRQYRRARGQDTRYIYVIEGRHGDHRPHVHLILNASPGGGDLEIIRSLWRWGDDVQLDYLGRQGAETWAGYLTKERREQSLNGKKQFVASRNLSRPITRHAWVDEGAGVDAPPGALILDEGSSRNNLASCRWIKYRLPERLMKEYYARARVISDSKYSVTIAGGVEKMTKTVDNHRKRAYNGRGKKKLTCPRCGRRTRICVEPGKTHLQDFPLWCDKCKTESIVDYDGVSQRPASPEPTA